MAKLRMCNGCEEFYSSKLPQCPNDDCDFVRKLTTKTFQAGYGGSPWAKAIRQDKIDFRTEDMATNIESYR